MQQRRAPNPNASGDRGSLLHGRVLVACADASERSWLAGSLNAFGLQTTIVANSDALLQAFLGGETDLVCVDAALPGAVDACVLMRQQDSHMPLMLLAGPGALADVTDAVIVRKPLNRQRLHDALANRLRRRASDGSGTEDADLVEHLATLRRDYVGRLDASMLKPMQGAADSGDWQTLRQLAHRLTGTAGCHGLTALAMSARQLEDALLPPSHAGSNTVILLLEAVSRAAEDALAEVHR